MNFLKKEYLLPRCNLEDGFSLGLLGECKGDFDFVVSISSVLSKLSDLISFWLAQSLLGISSFFVVGALLLVSFSNSNALSDSGEVDNVAGKLVVAGALDGNPGKAGNGFGYLDWAKNRISK